MNPRILICLDRNGFIVKKTGAFPGRHWPHEELELMPRVEPGLRLLREIPGARLVMVTNQAGPARGLVREEHIPEINAHVLDMLRVRIDGVYVCVHVPEKYARKHDIQEPNYGKYVRDCDCRKPRTGMLCTASQEQFGIPLEELDAIYVLGDRSSDVQTGLNAGARGKGGLVPVDTQKPRHLEAVRELQRAYGFDRVFIGTDCLDLAEQIVADATKEIGRIHRDRNP